MIYLFLLLAVAAMYVGQRVYTGREQSAVDRLGGEVDSMQLLHDQLLARRDSLISLTVIEQKADRLGLVAPSLDQMARLPLDAPILHQEQIPTDPSALADAAGRIWKWLDPPTVSSTEALAGE